MKKIMVSFLALAALGITSLGTVDAGAGQWFGSGWYKIGTYRGYSTPGSCSGCAGGVYTAVFAVGQPTVPAGETIAQNESPLPGQNQSFPTCIAAFTQCNDQSYIVAPYACSNVSGGAASATIDPTGSYSAGIDTGQCPALHPMQAGGVAVYQW